jgi:hypothetical protein
MAGADTAVVVVAAMEWVAATVAMAAAFGGPATMGPWAVTAVVPLAAIAPSVDFEAALAEARAVALAATAASAAATAASAAAMVADIANESGCMEFFRGALGSHTPSRHRLLARAGSVAGKLLCRAGNSMKKSIDPRPWLFPRPVLLVSTRVGEGRDNIITVSWAGVVCTKPSLAPSRSRPVP